MNFPAFKKFNFSYKLKKSSGEGTYRILRKDSGTEFHAEIFNGVSTLFTASTLYVAIFEDSAYLRVIFQECSEIQGSTDKHPQ